VKISQLRNALHTFFWATDPPTTFAEHSPETPRSRRDVLGLLAVGVVGTVALIRLAIHVSNPVHQAVGDGGNSGEVERISLWLHPALYALAHHPPESDTLDSQEAFQSYARQNGLERTWYIFRTQQVLADGTISVIPTIRHPFRMPDHQFSEFPVVLATAAGRPPVLPADCRDFSTAKVFVIPEELLSIDPIQALPDLELLERRSTSADTERGRRAEVTGIRADAVSNTGRSDTRHRTGAISSPAR
jgi:hypothetical protein